MNIITTKIGIGQLDPISGLPVIQAINPIEDDDDFEDFGETAYFGPSGLTSLPYSQDDNGFCEGLVVRDVAGLNGVLLGFRDDRVTEVYGNLSPGDTALHTTGPLHASQVLLKEDARQACILTKDTDDKDVGMIIDGVGKSLTIFGFGGALKISEDGVSLGIGSHSISLTSDGVFQVNSTSGILGGAATATPANAIAVTVAGPVNAVSTSWFASL